MPGLSGMNYGMMGGFPNPKSMMPAQYGKPNKPQEQYSPASNQNIRNSIFQTNKETEGNKVGNPSKIRTS